MKKIYAAILVGLFAAPNALACVAPTPMHDPTRKPSDVVVEAMAGKIVGRDTFYRQTDAKVVNTWLGVNGPATVRLSWAAAGGMCGPPGPIPEEGAYLLIYLIQRNGKLVPQGWRILTAKPDRRAIEAANEEARKHLNLRRTSPFRH